MLQWNGGWNVCVILLGAESVFFPRVVQHANMPLDALGKFALTAKTNATSVKCLCMEVL